MLDDLGPVGTAVFLTLAFHLVLVMGLLWLAASVAVLPLCVALRDSEFAPAARALQRSLIWEQGWWE